MRRVDWCADCWAVAEDACRGGHWVLDRGAAEEGARAEFAAATLEVARLQLRLDSLAEARTLGNPVLKGRVAGRDSDGYHIPGGAIRIALAATQSLTARLKRAICEQLTFMDLDFSGSNAFGYVDLSALSGLRDTLPDCLDCGQETREGTVTLDRRGLLQVHLRKTKKVNSGPDWDRGLKVFGYVQSGLDGMIGSGCSGDCGGYDRSCYCNTGEKGSTTLDNVKFEA